MKLKLKMTKESFSFGQNWKSYLKNHFNEHSLNVSISSLKNFLEVEDLKGKTFLDIGCGSGVFSLAAHRLNAKRVISFDIDVESVECCKFLREKESNPKNWEIYHGSVLDDKFMATLQKADVVHAWGVLHHTGDIWKAIRKASESVKDNGVYYFTIYNKKFGFRGSHNQLKLKRLYNYVPKIMKNCIEIAFLSSFFLKNLLFFRNPFKIMERKKSIRGMNFMVDIKDWFGGLPYEYATPQEIINFCNTLNIKFVKKQIVDTDNLLGNNLYLYEKV